MKFFKVIFGPHVIDRIKGLDKTSAKDIKAWLVQHDGYNPRIRVVEEKTRPVGQRARPVGRKAE